MMYCSLDTAFQSPSPGCMDTDASRQARKEERRKARKAKVLPMNSSIDPSRDPDRQHLIPLPDVPAMNSSLDSVSSFTPDLEEDSFDTYNKAKQNSKAWGNPHPPSSAEYDKDTLDKYSKAEQEGHFMTIPVNGHTVTTSKRFFGAQGPTDEPYADYIPGANSQMLQPDFTKVFQMDGGSSRVGTSSALPPPVMDMYWKPLTPSGTTTSFLSSPSSASASALPSSMTREHLPPHHSLRSAYEKGEISMEDVMKKLDKLFTKLDDMNHSTPEQLTSEMLMFISSGIFVLFLMDLLVKRGGR